MNWKAFVEEKHKEQYMIELFRLMNETRKAGVKIVPSPDQMYRALQLTPVDKVQVCLLGQDPYPSGGFADGLAFSTDQPNVPKSLGVLIEWLQEHYYGELEHETNSLHFWAIQGVLLLNSALSVEEGRPGTMMQPWKPFIEEILKFLFQVNPDIVFLTFGAIARNLVIDTLGKAVFHVHAHHPAYYARIGGKAANGLENNPFRQVNEILTSQNKKPIIWHLKSLQLASTEKDQEN